MQESACQMVIELLGVNVACAFLQKKNAQPERL